MTTQRRHERNNSTQNATPRYTGFIARTQIRYVRKHT
jgi:hypothetical protein